MNPARIVLIEDNPGDILLVEMALKENHIPYQLTQFDTGLEALRVLCESATADTLIPDAILLDLNTPGSDGFHVLIKLTQSARLSHVPIAILTSSQASSDRHRAALQGVRYIQKPSQLVDFLTTVGGAVKEMLQVRALEQLTE